MAIQVLRTMRSSLPMRSPKTPIKPHSPINLNQTRLSTLKLSNSRLIYSRSSLCSQWAREVLGGEQRQPKLAASSQMRLKKVGVLWERCWRVVRWFNQTMGPLYTRRRVTLRLRKNSETLSCVLVRCPHLLTRPLTFYLCPNKQLRQQILKLL